MACADLSSCLSRNDLPTSSIAEVRRACRELRQREPSDFDTTWHDLAGELPAWLLIDPELLQSVLEWIDMPTGGQLDYLHEHAGTLWATLCSPSSMNSNSTRPMIRRSNSAAPFSAQHSSTVSTSPTAGCSYGKVVDAWINTDTWAASRAFLDEHHTDLASDEAMAILTDLAADGESAAIIYHVLLTLVRLDNTNRAYDAIVDPAQLQAELAAARGDAVPRLIAYATIGVGAHQTMQTSPRRASIWHSVTRNDPAIDHDLVIRARNSHPTRFRCGWATSAPSWEPGLTARRH